jgi:hypothetical protein
MIDSAARRHLLAISLFFVLSSTSAAGGAEKVAVSIEILTEMNIAEISIRQEPFADWVKPIIAMLESQFENDAARRTVVVQVTLHPKCQAEVLVAGSPGLSPGEVASVRKVADAAKAPNSNIVDCSFRIWAKINGGHPDEKAPLVPPLETPDQRRLSEFRAASTALQLAIMRRWARTEAVPILAASTARVEPKWEGVRRLGKTIGALKADDPIDVAALTDRNPDYWRAMMEMAPGNPLVFAVVVALHAANGEIDRARRFAEISAFFDSNKAGFSRLLGDFREMSHLYYEGLDARIKQGIALHDKAQFGEALKLYEAILKDDPRSAWAQYEQFHTRRALALKTDQDVVRAQAGWAKARQAILGCDPLYQTMAEASRPVESYQLIRRMQIGELFKDRGKVASDVVEYADIALDLEVYGFAGLLYWEATTVSSSTGRDVVDLVESCLFCLDQLGIKDIKRNFKGDHAAAFARIKAHRQKLMEQSPMFKAVREPATEK